ncbi:uncharacterized protein LOC116601186 [Nematostella vectensis]|uniref:uncharacterized protein LOC116601186 n=1 Tax=Nematostella vectensis TaxID=45351 RepID=UPI002077504D|nr:uncharacterized protein LOC116601186 [Nematostella vectensis]
MPRGGGLQKRVARSCKDLRGLVTNSILATGEYWIDPEGDRRLLRVFCDMHTDRGGWTLVTRITPAVGHEQQVSHHYRAVSKENYSTGNVLVARRALVKLQSLIAFTQLRWRCRKQSVGRTIDIMTANNSAGANALDHFLDRVTFPDAWGSFVRYRTMTRF